MTSNAKYFKNIFIWLMVLSCFVAGWTFDGFRRKRENYRFLWNKVAEHEQRLLKLEVKCHTMKAQ